MSRYQTKFVVDFSRSKPWFVGVKIARSLSALDYRCLRNIADVWWEGLVSNDEVLGRALGEHSRPLPEITALHALRWLGYVLRMSPYRLFFLFVLHVLGKVERSCSAV